MANAVYLVVPGGRVPTMDGIARRLEGDDGVDRLGCVAERASDRDRLRTGPVGYDRVDLATDLSAAPPNGNDDPTEPTASLDRLRSEYGCPFLTPFVVADARFDEAPRETWRALVERAFGFFERVLDEFGPTTLVTPDVSSPFEWVPARVAAQEGTYVWWKTTRVGRRYGLIEGSPREEFYGLAERFERITSGEADGSPEARRAARSYAADLRRSDARPDFYARRSDSYGGSPLRLLFPYGLPKPAEFVSLLRAGLAGTAGNIDDRRLPRVRNVWRRVRTQASGVFDQPRADERYVFFPLHAQPEPSTRIVAPMYEDQVALARQAARSLPVDCHLYVKDHPRMFRDNTRPVRYYRELAAIPGVRVLDPGRDSHALTRESEAVLTVVGTPALEASFLGTPAVVFGHVHFESLPGVRRCRALDGLSERFSWALSNPVLDDGTGIDYLTAVFEQSFAMGPETTGSSPEAQRRLAAAVTPPLLDWLRTA